MGAKSLIQYALRAMPRWDAKSWPKAGAWFWDRFFEHVAGIQTGTSHALGTTPETYYPDGTGETEGELYIAIDRAEVWIWQSGAWTGLTGSGGGGGGGTDPAAVHYKDFLVAGITQPYVALSYAPTFTGGNLTKETWTDSGTARTLKTIDYAYSGGLPATAVTKAFDPADGVTIISQTTETFTFVAGVLTSITSTRDV